MLINADIKICHNKFHRLCSVNLRAANWWLRSALASSSNNFAAVNNNGNSNSNNANNSNGVAFGSSPRFGFFLADKVTHG